jgi:hypothetical protein
MSHGLPKKHPPTVSLRTQNRGRKIEEEKEKRNGE